MIRICIVIISALILTSPSFIFSQDDNFGEVVEIIPNPDYEAGWLHSFFFGKHWRDFWTYKIPIEKLNLEKYEGGLSPEKLGGGQQTKSLHFIAHNGKKYKFRSLNKFPGRSLPEDLQGTLAEFYLKDQVTITNPYSSLVTSPLMEALQILHSPPGLFILPDDSLLLEYREEFKNMPGTLEEKPDDYKDENLNFAGADKIRDTFKMYKELEEDNDNTVVQSDFLKARLFDIFIGDRDRHAGQWDWAEYRIKNKKYYKPIPKDRDFAFPLYDGLVPKALTVAITSFVNFDFNMPSMIDMTWEGRHLDRRLLSRLNKAQWDSVALFMQSQLTDIVIENAVKQLPSDLYNLYGFLITEKLKSRRDQLKSASDEFYSLSSECVDIYGSDKPEFVVVDRIDNDLTKVVMYKRDKDTGMPRTEKLYERIFENSVTDEIRIHLLGNDDSLLVKGNTANGILVLGIGGEGSDAMIDSSNSKEKFAGLIPYNSTKTKFYDSGSKSIFLKGGGTYLNTKKYSFPEDHQKKYEPDQEDRRWDFGAIIPFDINSDYGLVIGAGGGFNFYDFRIVPYSYRLEGSIAYSTLTRSSEINLVTDFNQLIEGSNVNFSFRGTSLEITRFYGLGNNTIFNDQLREDGFYNVKQTDYSFRPVITTPLTSAIKIAAGGEIEYSNVRQEENSILSQSEYNGEGKQYYLSGLVSFIFDSRDVIQFPFRGFYASATAQYYPVIFNNENAFGKISTDIRGYISGNFITDFSLALRNVISYSMGEYPFFKGAAIGGKSNLRGLPRNRFVGDLAALGQFELRFYIAKPKIILPGTLGANLFVDVGRVFLENENSDTWHASIGAGLWLSVIERKFTASFNMAKSNETLRVYLSIGQAF